MYRTMYGVKIAFGILVLFLALACQVPESEGSPSDILPAIPQKRLMSSSTPVEFICYIDAAQGNPLNAKDYIFPANADSAETQFFNYVVLGYSYLVKNEQGYAYLELTPALQYILANSKTYIKPLRQKGIQVVIEVRSGNYGETEDGVGLGLGTLSMAAINELTKELKLVINKYGIDGFEFNDIDGGKSAYPPLTRNLKQFQSNAPLYPDSLFETDDGSHLPDAEITDKLWIEGGSNLGNLIQRTNEALKESYSNLYDAYNFTNNTYGITADDEVERVIIVRNTGHGGRLLANVRDMYMPDAYSGAKRDVVGNLKYVASAAAPLADASFPAHMSIWNEEQKTDDGKNLDDRYTPFVVDLGYRKNEATVRLWAKSFLLKDPDGSTADSDNQNRYGALYFTNLGPVTDGGLQVDFASYLTYFSWELFRRRVSLADSPNAGNYKKDW
ncbi:MAG: hypothetical protein LBH75_03855 [Treponema sp.]|nr:hypothetical protein [Treponema sp.]